MHPLYHLIFYATALAWKQQKNRSADLDADLQRVPTGPHNAAQEPTSDESPLLVSDTTSETVSLDDDSPRQAVAETDSGIVGYVTCYVFGTVPFAHQRCSFFLLKRRLPRSTELGCFLRVVGSNSQ
jgi:hypothetical protein